jgi:hypothetical protein
VASLLPFANLHYNRLVRSLRLRTILGFAFLLATSTGHSQQAPPPSAARILILPRKLITGERATLAVLDFSGRLTPGVDVKFSDGEKVTTDTTGRALFAAPLNPGTITASIAGRTGRVSSSILPEPGVAPSLEVVTKAPQVASLSDRFELLGDGFCGDADANQVTIAGLPGLVLASSPASLEVLPPSELEPGPAQIQLTCAKKAARPFTIVFVALELESKGGSLAPGEHRSLVVRVRGTNEKVRLEAQNLAPKVADLTGGDAMRATSSGGPGNSAAFEVVGKQRGNFAVSIRLLAPLSEPRP